MSNQYKRSDATHKLKCSHVVGHNTIRYTQPCLILKEMRDGVRFKVIAFGDLHWNHSPEKQNVRYVHKSKVIEI